MSEVIHREGGFMITEGVTSSGHPVTTKFDMDEDGNVAIWHADWSGVVMTDHDLELLWQMRCEMLQGRVDEVKL